VTELLVVLVGALMLIAAAAVVGPRLGIASPLVLVVIGVAASFAPVFRSVQIQPEWILAGVLPPLLYSSAVSMPAMNFRREFGAISGLSVLLIIASALVLGLFFMLVIPGFGFAWGVALGAIISPTDAVATSIIKQASVSKRVVALLDGESLLNDASALVLLRTAIVATAASFSFWDTLGRFVYSVAVAAVLIAAGAFALTVAVRAAYVAPLLGFLAARVRHSEKMRLRVQGMQERMGTPEGKQEAFKEVNRRKRPPSERDLSRFAVRIRRVLADIEYFLREPLGWREGGAVIWAGMRGAVTVAAARCSTWSRRRPTRPRPTSRPNPSGPASWSSCGRRPGRSRSRPVPRALPGSSSSGQPGTTGSRSSRPSGRRCWTPATTAPLTPTSWKTRSRTSTRTRSRSSCGAS
jgi:hypothetical protein